MNNLEDLYIAIIEELDLVNNETPYVADMIKTSKGKAEVVEIIMQLIIAGNTISQAIVTIDNTYDINNPDNG